MRLLVSEFARAHGVHATAAILSPLNGTSATLVSSNPSLWPHMTGTLTVTAYDSDEYAPETLCVTVRDHASGDFLATSTRCHHEDIVLEVV
jgi:hypothetical protein